MSLVHCSLTFAAEATAAVESVTSEVAESSEITSLSGNNAQSTKVDRLTAESSPERVPSAKQDSQGDERDLVF